MRNIGAWELLSLDGVIELPEKWSLPYTNDEMEEANASRMAESDESDALLLGRVTYEELAAFCPNQPNGDPMWTT
jgi:dihydrofolate reductase